MRIEGATVDLLEQMREIAKSTSSQDVASASAAVDTSSLSPVERHVLAALRGEYENAGAVRAAIAQELISGQLQRFEGTSAVAQLAESLVADDPIFAKLVDQTILMTTRELMER